jgi:hypothetical protein
MIDGRCLGSLHDRCSVIIIIIIIIILAMVTLTFEIYALTVVLDYQEFPPLNYINN